MALLMASGDPTLDTTALWRALYAPKLRETEPSALLHIAVVAYALDIAVGDFVCERASSALLCIALGARGEHGSVSKDGSVICVTYCVAVVCYVYLILGDITLF